MVHVVNPEPRVPVDGLFFGGQQDLRFIVTECIGSEEGDPAGQIAADQGGYPLLGAVLVLIDGTAPPLAVQVQNGVVVPVRHGSQDLQAFGPKGASPDFFKRYFLLLGPHGLEGEQANQKEPESFFHNC